MGGKSNYLEGKVLDHLFGIASYSAPATVYAALYTATPSDSGGGTEVTTAGGTLYARVAITNDTTEWSRTDNAITNDNDVVFPTAGADWGTVEAFALLDASTDGNLLYWGALTQSKTINNGDTAKFAAGDIDITED